MEMKWFDRKFTLGIPLCLFPNLVERLRGTPVRLEERSKNLSPSVCTTKILGSWSIQENVGHLLDLEDLWLERLEDFENNLQSLSATDMENLKTENVKHNEKDFRKILSNFSVKRAELIKKLEKTLIDFLHNSFIPVCHSERMLSQKILHSVQNDRVSVMQEV